MRRANHSSVWVRAFVIACVVTTGLTFVAQALGVFRDPELRTIDARFAVRGPVAGRPDVAVVKIDDVTFNALRAHWPFPRSYHAKVIDQLKRAGASVIAYDVQFTEPTVPAQDNALIESVANAGNVVLATSEVDRNGKTDVFGGGPILKQIHAAPRREHGGLLADGDGVIRRMGYSYQKLESFALVATQAKAGHPILRAALAGGRPIDFRGPPGDDPGSISKFSRVLQGRFDPALVRGRVVVVGVSAPSLQDVHPTAVDQSHLMSGAELAANEIDTALRGFPLSQAPGWLDALLFVFMGLAVPAALVRLRPLPAFAAAFALGVAYAVAAQLAFNSGLIVPVVYPLVALALSTVAVITVGALRDAVERQRVRDLFARFVPAQVVEEAMARADGGTRLGGVRREATVLFSDLRGFTAFAERLEPDRVIEVLNHYLGEMSDAIMGHGGTLVSYMGDGIMAVFGAPVPMDDHADRAVAAVREMMTRLDGFNEWLGAERSNEGFRMGIGLNSGLVMSGNVGSETRLEYTAIGDTTQHRLPARGNDQGHAPPGAHRGVDPSADA